MNTAAEAALEPQKKSRGRPKKSIVAALKGDLMTVHIQFPTADVERIDAYAAEKRLSRSSAIRSIVIEHLKSANFLAPTTAQPTAADAFSKFWDKMSDAQKTDWIHMTSGDLSPPNEKK